MAETTIQGWQDFEDITGKVDESYSCARMIYNHAVRLQLMKIAIMDDPARKAELEKVLDVHPIYSLAGLTADYQKLMLLKTYLETNGYI